MSAQLIDFLARRAPRERLLLAVLVLVFLPISLWLGVLLPLQEQRLAAERALGESQALKLWVSGRALDMAALQSTDAAGPRPPIGLSGLEQSLIAAGLRDVVTDLSNRTGGGIALRFDAVAFNELMSWLSQEDPAWGYDIESLRLERGEAPGIVLAELDLVQQQR